ncbi:uncharacterized protein LOC120780079 [Bactrocera tryoni]|uniref:uncharacterized protein LOC120780079 n=1 Tax=Bactrocera tryoni TaxID=59916 RepID=UPI001A966083|nr:uncharacterized protein LOC120780079 [Bactrocera tryoni]
MRLKHKAPSGNLSDSGNDSSSDDYFKFQSKFTSRQTFNKQQETDICDYVKKCAFYSYGLTYQTLKKFAYDYAKAKNLVTPTAWEKSKEAGEDWLYGFLKRNDSISLRKPEKISLARLRGFTKSAVESFFKNLTTLFEKYSFQPKDIYNLDETGLTTVMEPIKICAAKGQRSVSQACSAERGSLVTIVGIVNACGNRLPPAYIFPRVRFSERFGNGCMPGSLILNTKSGWMISELFANVLKHIKNFTNCSVENPILILLDNHASHCSLESINYCAEAGIVSKVPQFPFEDILHHFRIQTNNPDFQITDEIYNEGLILIEDQCLTIANKLLIEVGMIAPNRSIHNAFNQEFNQELQYNVDTLQEFVEIMCRC